MNNSFWISWEDHRRSRELARALDVEYVTFISDSWRPVRYLTLSLKTLRFIKRENPNLVIAQNPSVVLAALLAFVRNRYGFKLVVDRHSNFKFDKVITPSLKWKIFKFLSDYSVRNSDITIVTNDYLKNYVEDIGGSGVVLPDKLPKMEAGEEADLPGDINFMFVSTFSHDEPILEVVEAAKLCPDNFHFYITGNYKKYKGVEYLISVLPGNVHLTGFISERDYANLMASVDVVVVITDQEHTLTCGAYEAVALDKPMVLGNTQAIKRYFRKGAIYASPTKDDLAASFKQAESDLHRLGNEVIELKSILGSEWERSFKDLCANIARLA